MQVPAPAPGNARRSCQQSSTPPGRYLADLSNAARILPAIKSPEPPRLCSSPATHARTQPTNLHAATAKMVATMYAARFHTDLPYWERRYGKLPDDDLKTSASNAKAPHLARFRLVIPNRTNPDILPAFVDDHAHACPRCHTARSPQKLDQTLDAHLTRDDVGIKSLLLKSFAELNSMPCPDFWTALVDCLPAYPPRTNSYHLRPKPTPNASDVLVNPSSQTDSSSPTAPRSSSPFSDEYELDEDVFAKLREVPESLANYLAYTFDRAALSCLHQDGRRAEFRPRLHPVRYTAQVGPATVTAWDDGGVAKFNKRPGAWQVDDQSVTSRESKTASAEITYDKTTGEIYPVITNENVAQILVEVVTAMRQDPRRPRDRIVIVVQRSVFSCYMDFRARAQYHPFHDAQSDALRQALVDKYPEETCIEMTSTRWLCLLKPSHRTSLFCNRYASLRMYAPPPPSHPPLSAAADHDHQSDEEDEANESTGSQHLPIIAVVKGKPRTNRKRPRDSLDSNYTP